MPRRERCESQPPRAHRPARPTPAQREVIQAVRAGESCRVVANAGSGKTATILAAYEVDEGLVGGEGGGGAPRRRVLFLEYNRDLKEDVQARVQASDALRGVVEATNYDSLLVRYYDANAASKDFALSLLEVLDDDVPPRTDGEPLSFDVLVIDEAQDLDAIYLQFVKKLLRDNDRVASDVQLISIGDPKQTIYRYRGASPQLFVRTGPGALHEAPPCDFSLGATFRFGQALCDLVDALGERLFPAPNYLRHTPATDIVSTVQRFVLPEDRQTLPTALLACFGEIFAEEEEPMAWLAGTTRNTNVRLWDVVEALGMSDLYATALSPEELAERPIERLAVRINTAHKSKGKTYAAVALFLTNLQTWLDRKQGVIAPEILYVALTRAQRRLVIVESADSMIFHDVLQRLQLEGHPAVPPPRCAVTGAPLLPAAPGAPVSHWAPPTVCEALAAAGGRAKQALLASVGAPQLGPWPEPPSPVEILPPLTALGVRATWLRAEHERGDRLAAAGLWQTLLAPPAPTTPAGVYPRFYATDRNRLHRLTPSLAARLERLLAASPPERYGWAEWLELARFSPRFNYGHAAQPPTGPPDEAACELHLQRLRAVLVARPTARPTSMKLKDSPLDVQGLFVDDQGALLLVLDDVDSERAQDRLLAAVAAALHGLPRYEIVYVRHERSCSAEVGPEARAALRQGVLRLLGPR